MNERNIEIAEKDALIRIVYVYLFFPLCCVRSRERVGVLSVFFLAGCRTHTHIVRAAFMWKKDVRLKAEPVESTIGTGCESVEWDHKQ